MYIWRDEHDKDAHHFGTRIRKTLVWWMTVYKDGIAELFGSDIAIEIIEHASQVPLEINIHKFAIRDALNEERERLANIAQTWHFPGRISRIATDTAKGIAEAIRSEKD